MSHILVAIIAQFCLLAVYVALHLIISRYLQPEKRWRTMKLLFFPGLLLAMIFGFVLGGGEAKHESITLSLFAVIALTGLLHIGYLTVYAVFDRSITLRMMIDLMGAGKPLTFHEIEKLYNPDAALDRRLGILVDSGFMVLHEGSYRLIKKGRRMGRLIAFLKSLYKTGEGG